MRMRCFLWPCSLPNDLICRCKSVVTFLHILNCKYFITYRSIVHDSVRDQLYAMCKSFNIEAFIEPLVRKLSADQTDDSFGKRRADLVASGIDGVLNVVDVVSVDVCIQTSKLQMDRRHNEYAILHSRIAILLYICQFCLFRKQLRGPYILIEPLA
ncbi:hypothetical protein P9112_006984 [Eukaryota sp. TZLM1-RC]